MKHIKRLAVFLLAALCAVLLLAQAGAFRALRRAAYPVRYEESVERWASEYGVDPLLIYSVIRTESGFDPEAESSVGARGLMQITEETFDWIKSKIAADEEIGFDGLYDPDTNIRFGSYLVSVCLSRYGGDVSTAVAAYHSGMGLVDSLLESTEYSGDGVTLHTFPYAQMRNYVYKINRCYETYQSLYGLKGE